MSNPEERSVIGAVKAGKVAVDAKREKADVAEGDSS